MKNLIVLAVISAIVWFSYGKYKAATEAPASGVAATVVPRSTPSAVTFAPPSQQFTCDGRTHCSQMRSCAEATYFIRHCPNTKMDGDNDGVPCEQQWCN